MLVWILPDEFSYICDSEYVFVHLLFVNCWFIIKSNVITRLLNFLLLVILLAGCNKADDPAGLIIDVSQQWSFDEQGYPIVGLLDGQWQSKTFNKAEIALFNSLDTADLQNTSTPASVSDNPPDRNACFPNPFKDTHALYVGFNSDFSSEVVVKAVIVDSTMTAKSKQVSRLKGQNGTLFKPNIPAGKYRLYYTLSSAANPHFYRTWGNIYKKD